MRRIAFALLVLSFTSVMADRADCKGRPPGDGGSAVGVFNEVGGSGVGGKVSLRGNSSGSRVSISLKGLQTDVEYIAVYQENGDCAQEIELMSRVLGRFRGGKRGTASLTADATLSPGEIRSVAIRLGDGHALVACAPLN